MALTRDYKATVLARIQRDPKFAQALYAEALDALLTGETEEGLSRLRDLVHAEITFKELARQTGFDEKSLQRTLSRRGNPTARTLAKIVAAIREQAETLATVAPQHVNDARSEAARLITERAPGNLNKVFFTNGGTEAVEHAIRLARIHTGRHTFATLALEVGHSLPEVRDALGHRSLITTSIYLHSVNRQVPDLFIEVPQ